MRFLVVIYAYPPVPSVGSNRWAAMTKWLRRMGHEVDLITTGGWGPAAGELERGVTRTGDLVTAGPVRKAFRRGPKADPAVEAPPDKPAPRILTDVLVPDAYLLSWAPLVVPPLRRLVRQRRPDCVITSAPTESTHIAALALPRSDDGPVWLPEFRDGWIFEPYRPPFPTAFQNRLDRWLEARVIGRADGVIGVTEPIVEDFRRRFGVDATLAPNAWDPDLEAAVPAPPEPDGKIRLVHTGKMTSAWGRDPRPLFAGIRKALAAEPALAERLRLVLAGKLDTADAAALGEAELGPVLEHVGHLDRTESLALQRRADALVLITSKNTSEATGKLFEYLAAGRPILGLAGDNAAGRIVRATGTGATVEPDDVDGIAAAVLALARGELAASYDPHDLEPYRFPAPAAAIVAAAERACERRRR